MRLHQIGFDARCKRKYVTLPFLLAEKNLLDQMQSRLWESPCLAAKCRDAFLAANACTFCYGSRKHLSFVRPPLSPSVLKDQRQTILLKQACGDRGKIFGHRKLPDGLRDLDEDICFHKGARPSKHRNL